MKPEEYQKKLDGIRLRQFPEYKTLGFSLGASLILALLFLIVGLSGGAMRIAALIYGGTSVFLAIVLMLVKRSILTKGEISRAVRLLGIPLIVCMALSNVFAAIAGFTLVCRRNNVEYQLCSYMVLNTVCVMMISALNLFKPAQNSLFLPGMGILVVCIVIQAVLTLLTARWVDNRELDSRAKWLILPAALTGLTGNLFALALAVTLFKRVTQKNKDISIEWIDIMRRCFRNYTAVIGLFVVGLLVSLSLCSYLTFDYSIAVNNDYSHLYNLPSLMFPFGTDNFGRCIFSRIIFGARISLVVGMGATMVPMVIGCVLGAVAGYYGKTLDNTIMRLLDVIYAVPVILLAISIIASFGASVLTLILAISIYGIPVYARIVRAQVMTLADAEYVEAAKACGATNRVIIFRHILPNSLAPVIVRATLQIGSAILTTSALSYLGVGIPSHIPEWGNLLNVGSQFLEAYPHMAIFPGIAIVVLVLAFNFFGDGLRDALDPKMK